MQAAISEAEAQRERANALLVEQLCTEFFQDFIAALKFNLDSLNEIGMAGDLQPFRVPTQGERAYRAKLILCRRMPGAYPIPTFTDLHFSYPKGTAIRCYTAEGAFQEYRLCSIDGRTIGAVEPNGYAPLPAKHLAEAILKLMAQKVRNPSLIYRG